MATTEEDLQAAVDAAIARLTDVDACVGAQITMPTGLTIKDNSMEVAKGLVETQLLLRKLNNPIPYVVSRTVR